MKKRVVEARTYRSYSKKEVDLESVKEALEGSRFTAQSFNIQNSRYIICQNDRDKVEEIFNSTNLPSYHKVPCEEQPFGYIISVHKKERVKNKEIHMMNCGILFQNINLLLNDQGLKSICLISGNKKKIGGVIGLGDEYEIDYLIGYGYPNGVVGVADLEDETPVPHRYFKDEEGNHIVPKLTLERLLLGTQ